MLAENMLLPAGGWMPGEKQYTTGPFVMTGSMAPQPETSEVPSSTGIFFAMLSFNSSTEFCAID